MRFDVYVCINLIHNHFLPCRIHNGVRYENVGERYWYNIYFSDGTSCELIRYATTNCHSLSPSTYYHHPKLDQMQKCLHVIRIFVAYDKWEKSEEKNYRNCLAIKHLHNCHFIKRTLSHTNRVQGMRLWWGVREKLFKTMNYFLFFLNRYERFTQSVKKSHKLNFKSLKI